jgi:hypothetical protein
MWTRSGIEPLAVAGSTITRIAHAKTMVIDGEVWLTLRWQPAMLFWRRIRRHRIRQYRSAFYTVGAGTIGMIRCHYAAITACLNRLPPQPSHLRVNS